MIGFIKTWANQIIVAVIIATIFEMILPNINNRKYIKMIIGLYVLLTIIQPIVMKVTGNSLDLSNFNYKKYFNKDILETSSEDFENNNSNLIEQAYIDNIESDIKVKMKQKGYKVIGCTIHIINDEMKETYGAINSINLKIDKLEEGEQETTEKNTNIIKVENVDIKSNSSKNEYNKKEEEQLIISEKEKIDIINYLENEYSIEKKNIIIN